MKNYIILFFIIFISGKIEAQINSKKWIESQLKVIEDYVTEINKAEKSIRVNDTLVIKTNPINAIFFLEEVTGIKCDKEQSYDEMYIPSRKNLRKWKAWYRKNRNSIYWDENSRKVKIKT